MGCESGECSQFPYYGHVEDGRLKVFVEFFFACVFVEDLQAAADSFGLHVVFGLFHEVQVAHQGCYLINHGLVMEEVVDGHEQHELECLFGTEVCFDDEF